MRRQIVMEGERRQAIAAWRKTQPQIEKIEQIAKRKLFIFPQFDGAGLLWWVLMKTGIYHLLVGIREDFYQEAAVFLLENSLPQDAEYAARKEFCNAAYRHFYEMLISYGWHRRRGAAGFSRRDTPVSGESYDAESYDETQERLGARDEGPLEGLLSRERFEELVAPEQNLKSGEGRRFARALILYRDGAWKEDGRLFTWCGLCGKEMLFSEATIDHVLPRAEGGSDYLMNLHLAHFMCNQVKADRIPAIMVAMGEAARTLVLPEEGEPARRVVVGRQALDEKSLEEIQAMFPGTSRSTAWRIRKRGYFWAGDYRTCGERRRLGNDCVELTAQEKLAGAAFVADRFRLSIKTARRACERGWFALNKQNRHRVCIPEDRMVPREAFEISLP